MSSWLGWVALSCLLAINLGVINAQSGGYSWSSRWVSSSSANTGAANAASVSSSNNAAVAGASNAATAGASNAYYQYPNGQLRQLPAQAASICGTCPAGYQREAASGPYCGRCVQSTQTCANGYYQNGNQCQSCPCPGTTGDRRFGTTCRVESDGQVTCDCPSEYTGRDCSQCAPGAVQNNQYPYDCYRLNSTNSLSIQCQGYPCPQPSIPQIVQPMPQPVQTQCPVAQQYQYVNQSCGPSYVSPPVACPVTPTVPPTVGCPPGNNNGNCACPGQCPCPPNGGGCPVNCPTYPPPTLPPWTPRPVPACPGPVQCPIVQPPPPPTICPPAVSCPPTQPCPAILPCPTQLPCPQPQPCPACPEPRPCPIGPCPQPPPCPACPVVTQPCPNPCPSPCAPCPQPQPCPNPCPSPCAPCPQPQPCPSPCASPCAPCPTIPQCPDCRLECPACPITPCPPCPINNCNNCPNPCQPCPNPCQRCPDIPSCPSCNVSCPKCPDCPINPILLTIQPCICDPRGTVMQDQGECMCKVNVQGATCDRCKPGYFGLSSTRMEGCLKCFCSGLSDYCSVAPYYRSTLRLDRSANCSSIELTNEDHTVVYNQGSSGFSFDGQTASYSKGANRRLFWSLPSCLKGDRVTSYGGVLSFTRLCSGSGSSLGADHEVMLVSGSGATVFWTTFEDQKCNGQWVNVDVLLAESAQWSSWKGELYRRATRADIMEVLADLQLILVRATFTSNTQTTSIRNVSLSSVTAGSTTEGLALHVEACRCPTGYRGLSCENCAPGYYRDTSDMSRSVFGACRPCPCGKTADGCYFSSGHVVCRCKEGFSGPLCQDKEVITVTCDPFRIREAEGANVDFTCSFTTNSKRRLLMRLGREGDAGRAEEVTSITKTITLTKDLSRVACEVVDNQGVTWAVVYCAIELIFGSTVIVPPPPPVIIVVPFETFICINETDSVTLTCDVHSFGNKRITVEWRQEGYAKIVSTGKDLKIINAALDDAGTYICSASDGNVIGIGQIALMVRRFYDPMMFQYPIRSQNQMEMSIIGRHGGDYPNYPYQADQPSSDTNRTLDVVGADPSSKIGPVSPGHPKAVADPAEIIAKPGDTVILRCNATGEEPLKFYWKSGANDYIPAHVRVSHGALIFRSLRSQDAGVYYCVAWNHVGQSTARATIILDDGGSPSQSVIRDANVEVLNPELVARPGENVNLQCRSNTTNATLTWSRVNAEIPSSSEVRSDGVITLYRVSEKDKGTYLCTVTAPSGQTASAQAVLKLMPHGEVMVPPKVTITPKSPLRVRTGSKVRLECEGNGSPTPNVTWVRSIDGQDKKLVSTSRNKVIYEIKQMSKSDVGKYACSALNAVGQKSESLSLVIDDGQPCKDTEFRCKSGDQCIPREDRCDTEKDCRDGSDELNCKGNRRVRRGLSGKLL